MCLYDYYYYLIFLIEQININLFVKNTILQLSCSTDCYDCLDVIYLRGTYYMLHSVIIEMHLYVFYYGEI